MLMEKELKKELKLFQSLSSKEDYELIEREDISFEDFERMTYILQTLNLIKLDIYFFNKNIRKFQKQYEQLERINNEYEAYVDMDVLDNWQKSFVNGIKDSDKRNYVKEIFKMR